MIFIFKIRLQINGSRYLAELFEDLPNYRIVKYGRNNCFKFHGVKICSTPVSSCKKIGSTPVSWCKNMLDTSFTCAIDRSEKY